eukprot:TRINITY_DN3008_c0_g1_i1.p1 TRINITY_DN3008_c0_g1~~TRINITY_DN3008_c0_g1_i1.p1  ORF type:complete len:410 (+),score=11.97 TRINITY_DN3008_c0_g1_i1:24-1253(+)
MISAQYITFALVLVFGSSYSEAEWVRNGVLPFNIYDTSFTSNSNLLIYSGGRGTYSYSSMVNIFNTSSYDWNMNPKLSVARSSLASVSLNNKVFFAGGEADDGDSDLVEIYDVVAQEWSTAKLSAPRSHLATAVVGDSILFVGGSRKYSDYVASDVVDIYNAKNDSWTTATISNPRGSLAVAVIGSRALFAGGLPIEYSDIVEIYDADTESWSQDKLSLKRKNLAAVGLGDTAYFAGGESANGITDRIDVFYGSNNTWGRAKLSVPRTELAAGAAVDQVLFVAGWADVPTRGYIADIIFTSSGRMETVPLPNNEVGKNWLSTTIKNSIFFYCPGFSNAKILEWYAWNGTTGIRPVAPPRSNYVPYSYNTPSYVNQPTSKSPSGSVSPATLLTINGWICSAVISVWLLVA